MSNLSLVFAIHNHQPAGNFDSVFEEAYHHSYRPFVEVLERHPSVKFTQHWTGTLLEWLVEHHPEFIERLRGLVDRGQLEILTGAYYEAVLSVIPEADRIGQIRKLSSTITSLLSSKPETMWLAERVWEQALAGSLVKAGVRAVMVDDTHFRHAGLMDHQLYGRYITEEGGELLNLLPMDKVLRYTVPFRPLEQTLEYLRSVATPGGERVVIHADDGEKFGVWPKTFKAVYEDGWLESFCRMIEEQSSWLATVHVRDVIEKFPAQGRVYLPAASYSEMMKWALPAEAFQRLERFEQMMKRQDEAGEYAMFVRGGYWRNFMAKYPEANHMHKKMLRISRRVHAAAKKKKLPDSVYQALWTGQCNDPYWHGVFGGLYLPNLRYPVYRSLIEAEKGLDALEKKPATKIEVTDFDADGSDEILVESPELNLTFAPALGGSLIELDFKPCSLNLLDIVTRREEGYHRRLKESSGEERESANVHDAVLVKEKDLHRHLQFDWYRRASLLDHFFGPSADLGTVSACQYHELGDFVNQPYTGSGKVVKGEARVSLRREGGLWFEGRKHPITVEKLVRYAAGSGSFEASYVITNGGEPVDIRFGVEFNVGLQAGDAADRYYRIDGKAPEDPRLRSTGESQEVSRVTLTDEWLGVETEIEFGAPATVWRFPVETVSLSEAGFERIYQSSVIIPVWELRLEKEHRIAVWQSTRRRA
jgi:4-alpha-glucanotransferase